MKFKINIYVKISLEITSLDGKMSENIKDIELVKRASKLVVEGSRSRSRPKKECLKVIHEDGRLWSG